MGSNSWLTRRRSLTDRLTRRNWRSAAIRTRFAGECRHFPHSVSGPEFGNDTLAACVRSRNDAQPTVDDEVEIISRVIAPEIVSKLFTRKLANLARVPFIETAGWRGRARNFAVIAVGPTVSLQQF